MVCYLWGGRVVYGVLSVGGRIVYGVLSVGVG